jgi:hypothetical protein
MMVSMSEQMSAFSWSILTAMLSAISGPTAFLGLMLLMSFSMPFLEIEMFFMINHANVAPVYKKGDKHHPANYRPIYLTCISCKLLEHVIASNMMEHLD